MNTNHRMIELKDCNNCQHCSPKEYEQTKDKEPHMCQLLGKRLKHGTNSKSHYAIEPLPDCPLTHKFMEGVIKSQNVIDIGLFHVGSVYSIWNSNGERIFTGMLVNVQATYMEFLKPLYKMEDQERFASYYIYYQDIEMRGTRIEIVKEFSDWFGEII
jgi:hypothetical protein